MRVAAPSAGQAYSWSLVLSQSCSNPKISTGSSRRVCAGQAGLRVRYRPRPRRGNSRLHARTRPHPRAGFTAAIGTVSITGRRPPGWVAAHQRDVPGLPQRSRPLREPHHVGYPRVSAGRAEASSCAANAWINRSSTAERPPRHVARRSGSSAGARVGELGQPGPRMHSACAPGWRRMRNRHRAMICVTATQSPVRRPSGCTRSP